MIEPIAVLQSLRWLWIAVYAVIAAVHLGHVATCTESGATVWHIGHVVMCSGMVSMFLPMDWSPIPPVAWIIIFSGVLAAIGVITARDLAVRGALDPLWLLLTIDVCAMLYMIVAPQPLYKLGASILMIYFAVEMLAWLGGVFDTRDPRRRVFPTRTGLKGRGLQAVAVIPATANKERGYVMPSLMAAGMSYMFAMMSLT